MPFPKKYIHSLFEYYFTDCNNSKIRNWKTALRKFGKLENSVGLQGPTFYLARAMKDRSGGMAPLLAAAAAWSLSYGFGK